MPFRQRYAAYQLLVSRTFSGASAWDGRRRAGPLRGGMEFGETWNRCPILSADEALGRTPITKIRSTTSNRLGKQRGERVSGLSFVGKNLN